MLSLLLFVSTSYANDFDREVLCYKRLYKAKIASKSFIRGYARIPFQIKNKDLGLYLVNSEKVFYCPLPKSASIKGKSYKTYDMKIHLSADKKPFPLTHVVQFQEIDLESTLGRISRMIASKVYKPVKCKEIQSNTKLAKKYFHKKLMDEIKKTPQRFNRLTKNDQGLQDFPSEISEKMIRAMESCQIIPEIKKITQSSFKKIPRFE